MPAFSACISGLVASGAPQGCEKTVGDLPCYVAEPQTRSKSKTVIIFCDIFGWRSRMTRLVADAYARHGFYVYVPNFHQAPSFELAFLQTLEPPLNVRNGLSLMDRARNTANAAAALGPWQQTNRESVIMPLIDNFIGVLRSTAGTAKVGALGFSTGGRYCILQAHTLASNGVDKKGGVDAAVAFYPHSVSIPADFNQLGRPFSLGIAGQDSVVDAQTRTALVNALQACTKAPHEIKRYDNQVHGFATRGDWSGNADKQAMDTAERQGVEWFNKYLG